MFDANGAKSNAPHYEKAFSVEYMDLHILKPECGIGIHRQFQVVETSNIAA